MINSCPAVFERKKGVLHFSQKVDYGLFFLLELAKNSLERPLSLKTVSKNHRMSFYFLQKVARDLRQKGIIEADRGKSGGYRLKKSLELISLGEVVEALEGPIMIMHCLDQSSQELKCERQAYCTLRPGLQKFHKELYSQFFSKPLAYFL